MPTNKNQVARQRNHCGDAEYAVVQNHEHMTTSARPTCTDFTAKANILSTQ